jgi:hypothetical protein
VLPLLASTQATACIRCTHWLGLKQLVAQGLHCLNGNRIAAMNPQAHKIDIIKIEYIFRYRNVANVSIPAVFSLLSFWHFAPRYEFPLAPPAVLFFRLAQRFAYTVISRFAPPSQAHHLYSRRFLRFTPDVSCYFAGLYVLFGCVGIGSVFLILLCQFGWASVPPPKFTV